MWGVGCGTDVVLCTPVCRQVYCMSRWGIQLTYLLHGICVVSYLSNRLRHCVFMFRPLPGQWLYCSMLREMIERLHLIPCSHTLSSPTFTTHNSLIFRSPLPTPRAVHPDYDVIFGYIPAGTEKGTPHGDRQRNKQTPLLVSDMGEVDHSQSHV